MVQFSIIICAYNSCTRLQKTLEHLAVMEYPSEQVEIILVDNNSTDGTGEFARDLWTDLKSNFSLNIVIEVQQGLNNARKRGIQESQFDYVVFCDDDNWLDSQYLKRANDLLTQNLTIGILGGQSFPVTDADSFPNWFYTYCGCFAVGVQGIKSGNISERGYVWGAGSIARRDLLLKVFSSGYEQLLSGRKGSAMGAGDDSELCQWFLIAGFQIWYEESMMFHHFIPKERLTLDYLERLLMGIRDSWETLEFYDRCRQHHLIRRSWYKKPVRWILCEIKFNLDRSPIKSRVLELVNSISGLIVP